MRSRRGAVAAARDPRVGRVFICTPDKDLAQSVAGTRIVQLNRRTNEVRDEAGVVAKFGVRPESIPDYLALVGDAADGYPGLPGWGAKSAAAVLARFKHIENIPADASDWHVNAASAASLARTLQRDRDLRLALPQSCDAPHRPAALRERRRTRLVRPDAGVRRARSALRFGGDGEEEARGEIVSALSLSSASAFSASAFSSNQ